jgi:putative oxidoreductase
VQGGFSVKHLSLLLRLLLGVLMMVAGALKLSDPSSFANEITNYRLLPQLAPWLAVTLPTIEITLGLMLILAPPTWRRAAALGTLTLLAVFTIAVGQVVVRGINVSCGCFGGNTGPVTLLTVVRDALLLSVAATILWLEPARP